MNQQQHGFAKYLTRRSQPEISKNRPPIKTHESAFLRSFVDIVRRKALVSRLRVMRLIKRRIFESCSYVKHTVSKGCL